MTLVERNRNNCNRAVGALLIAGLLLAGGCAERYNDLEAFEVEPHPLVVDEPYRLSPPDVITIESADAPELNQRHVIISPDGSINLPLLDRVYVAGLTTEEVAETLEELAGRYYEEVEVAVVVSQYRSKHIYVFGEVSRTGRYPYTGSDTLLALLAEAQPTNAADPNRIHVIRPHRDGRNADRMTIELEKWYEKGETERNSLLQEGDIVYVPPNGFARVGKAIQALLMPVQPAAQTFRGVGDIDRNSSRFGTGAN